VHDRGRHTPLTGQGSRRERAGQRGGGRGGGGGGKGVEEWEMGLAGGDLLGGGGRVVLFRHFLEVLVRLASLRFPELPLVRFRL
jgi:hypothetical protein